MYVNILLDTVLAIGMLTDIRIINYPYPDNKLSVQLSVNNGGSFFSCSFSKFLQYFTKI